MPAVDLETIEEKGEEQIVQAAKSSIGIIYPPPEVRNIVDKTASFVARNGPEFETRIRQNELNNPKFNFLTLSDPYHAYYKHKVKEFFEGKAQEPSSAPKSGFGFMQQKPQSTLEQSKLLELPVIPKEPPPEYEFVADPPSISAFDLDVVKLTAQFTARNGRQFLTNLVQRESRNYQFDFLRPQHSLFSYFTKLVEQYTKILIPPKDLLAKLRIEAESPKAILDAAKYRVEWARHQDRERKREEDEREKERTAYAQIDWHDFVVVETVDYQPDETGNLPPPTTPDEVGARVLAQERFEETPADEEEEEEEAGHEEGDEDEEGEENDNEKEDEVPRRKPAPGADTNVQDMEEDSDLDEPDEEDMLAASREEPSSTPSSSHPPLPPMPPSFKDHAHAPPLPPNPDQVIIRRDYNPKEAKKADVSLADDQFLISPITGEKIPADKIQEHMRIGLLDPKWLEQRDRAIAERRDKEEVYAPGSAIGSSLKQLAERRTDIFGSGAEETQIGKKIGEEEKKDKAPPKVTWDGHSGSMEKVAQKARENISIEEQIAVIHKVKGLLPDEEKEKIGPAKPLLSVNVPAPRPPAPTPVRPPAPPSTTSMLRPANQPPQNRPMLPLPPRPPLMGGPGGMMGMPGQPVMMMQQQQQVMGIRPPMPPMMGGPPMGMNQQFMQMPPRMPGAPPPPMRPPMPGQMAQQRPPMGGDDDEPSAKKAKTEEQLIPEHQFLAQNHGPVTFRVQVPNFLDKSEWKLNGQTFIVTLPLTDTVSVLKAKVFDETSMQAGKQKLQLEGMFLKDSNTLAFYNFTPMCLVQLQVKERGGRKK